MRIVFSQDTDVDLKTWPKSAFGVLHLKPTQGKRIETPNPADPEHPHVRHLDGPMGHYVPKGRYVQLPDAVAQSFIAAGVAEPVIDTDIAAEIELTDEEIKSVRGVV